jgi:hypothetical protein
MANKLADGAQVAACDAIVDSVESGTTNATGLLRFFTGTQNADANIPATGACCDCVLSNPAAGSSDADGLATFSPITSGFVTLTGTIQSFAILNLDETTVFTGSVTAIGGGGDLEINDVDVLSGGVISVSAMTYQVPQDQT